jgi:hypothetical protein
VSPDCVERPLMLATHAVLPDAQIIDRRSMNL